MAIEDLSLALIRKTAFGQSGKHQKTIHMIIGNLFTDLKSLCIFKARIFKHHNYSQLPRTHHKADLTKLPPMI